MDFKKMVHSRDPEPVEAEQTKKTPESPAAIHAEIVKRIDKLPPMPIISKLLKIINSPDSSAEELAGWIAKDQTLTAHILRIINSAYFAFRSPIADIKQAVITLGFKTIRSIVFATSTYRYLMTDAAVYGYSKEGIMFHSMVCAALSKHIMLELRSTRQSAEEVFLCGLLHDIGKTIAAEFFPESDDPAFFMDEIMRCGNDVEEAELKILGTSHTRIGVMIGERWHFPEDVLDVVKHHHKPHESESAAKKSAVVYFANYVVAKNHVGYVDQFRPDDRFLDTVLSSLSLSQEMIAGYEGVVEDVRTEARRFISLLGST